VIVPHHPGWGRSPRPEWIRSVRDLAAIYRGLLAQLGIEQAALIGLGFGGWIAAEMATMAPGDVARLVLVAPMGFYEQKAFDRLYGAAPSTEQLEAWDIAREMCFRVAWKPYMYSQTLPHLLASVSVPALVVWGDKDRVVPLSTANRFLQSLPNAKLEVVKDCGHCVDLEQPKRLADLVSPFIAR
jgi:pimeloyl-ACP methyl ester carboxylesterase